ncbi:MAG: CaiB/BaiF CoA-transferase family protein [Burkholderiaceae bacterium]|nr:CaiB/BaiF CoA-transferase family protein [Burkholderiaceae bacterium]MDO9090302.1 CaiB/BaiF CoA-transferase family protein [Burkholderiaceae bacterium]
MTGPLAGIKVIEIAGIGPGPFAAMLLADLGAEVIRVDRKQPSDLGLKRPREYDFSLRNRSSIELDLKTPEGIAMALTLIERSDAVMEGFRPGVMERLGLGPDVCLARNPRLVYGRMTGWGQSGPLSQAAGHDLNYIAVAGALHGIGRAGQPPSIPLNLLGDYAGGSLYLIIGMLAAIIDAGKSGRGQVVDAAIVDGTASLSTQLYGMLRAGLLNNERGTNFIDSGAHFYDVYECADGKWVSLGSVEPKFYSLMLKLLEIDIPGKQLDRTSWPEGKKIIAAKIRTRTRDEWTRLLEGTDVCFGPVLTLDEATQHPHLKARETFIEIDGLTQPAPAPRFSRTVPPVPHSGKQATPQTASQVLASWLSADEVAAAQKSGVL